MYGVVWRRKKTIDRHVKRVLYRTQTREVSNFTTSVIQKRRTFKLPSVFFFLFLKGFMPLKRFHIKAFIVSIKRVDLAGARVCIYVYTRIRYIALA